MRDAFDFQALKQSTPGYLGMESLSEALLREQAESQAPNSHDGGSMDVDENMANDLGDVSMQDQVLDEYDEAEEQKQPSSFAGESSTPGTGEDSEPDRSTGIAQKIMSPTQYGAQMALRHRENDSTQPKGPRRESSASQEVGKQLAHTDQPGTNELHNSASLAPVGPYTAHSGEQDMRDHGYEIRMPIPAPWQESLPYILSTYLQVAFNAALLLLFAYFVNILRYDVSLKVQERRAAVIRDATWCQHQYVMNLCGTGRAPPHLVESKKCLELEQCMEADPDMVRWLSMYASLAAEVLNELVKPLTVRTLMLLTGTVIVVLGVTFVVNYTFGFVRARTYFANHEMGRPRKTDMKEVRISAVRGPHADTSSIWRKQD